MRFEYHLLLKRVTTWSGVRKVEFFTISDSARSERYKSKLPLSAFVSIRYLLKYTNYEAEVSQLKNNHYL